MHRAGKMVVMTEHGGLRWKVFISHTAELRKYPASKSYIDMVERAVTAAGHSIVNMVDFAASDQPPTQVCIERVQECDVYIGVLGARYGSPVRDHPELSYTELEYDTAVKAGISRLMFVMDLDSDDLRLPPSAVIDHEYGARQAAFRARVTGVVLRFRNPDDLARLVERSLRELEFRLRQSLKGLHLLDGLPNLQTMAIEYNIIRDEKDTPERRSQQHELMNRMIDASHPVSWSTKLKKLALQCILAPGDARGDEDRGVRLVGYALLYAHPDVDAVDALAHVAVKESAPFGEVSGLRTLERHAIEYPEGFSRETYALLKKRYERLPSGHRKTVMKNILGEIGGRF